MNIKEDLYIKNKKISSEIELILENLLKEIPSEVDGKSAILEMKNNGSSNWRQMEWIGFWFEFFVQKRLSPKIGGIEGPVYGKTKFDFKRKWVWDLKSHPNTSDTLILNDKKALTQCIRDSLGIGFIVITGEVTLDDSNNSFKNWHDELKGGKSNYEIERIRRKAPSRKRKVKFFPKELISFWLGSNVDVENGLKEGWLSHFQENMRNSNGNPRLIKLSVKLSKIPIRNILLKKTISV